MISRAEPATFDESDWEDLTGPDKKALTTLNRYGFSFGFEPLARAAGVGQKSVDSLMSKGMMVEGEHGLHGRYFKLTEKGSLALEWLNGNRIREYPKR